MSVGLKSNVDGTSGAIQVNGSDVVTVNSSGNVGVAGTIQSTSGGFKFPDGTTQTTAVSGTLLRTTVFTSSGTWTKGANTKTVKVRGVGGGGGGYAAWSNSACPGGAGAYVEKTINVSAVASVSVTIGSGGAGSTTTPAAGGNTTFGAYCTAGGGGAANSTSSASVGGTATGGDLNVNGGNGRMANGASGYTQATSSTSSYFGQYPAYGSSPKSVATTAREADGIAGVVIVEEYA